VVRCSRNFLLSLIYFAIEDSAAGWMPMPSLGQLTKKASRVTAAG